MIVLDASAVTALALGHRGLARLADNAAASPFRHLLVPALCLLVAEGEEQGAGRHALSLPGIEVEALDAVAVLTVAEMIRGGFGEDTAHALYAAFPTAQRPTVNLILTSREDDYPPGTVTVDIDDKRLYE